MVEPQGLGKLKPGLGSAFIAVFEARLERPTLVRMANGDEFIVYDGTGWGRDLGDMWEHVSAESQADGQRKIAFFYLSDVQSLIDPDTRNVLISQTPATGET